MCAKFFVDSSRSLPQRNAEGTVSSSNNANNPLEGDPSTKNEVHDTPILTTMVVHIVVLSNSTPSPVEDVQYVVETSRSISR